MTAHLRLLWSRLRSFVVRDRLDREFDDELATHLELLIDEARGRGLSEVQARREALLKLGRPASLREQHRDARGLPLIDALVQDSQYAIRMLWKSPVFTTVVTLTLALGIGANTAMFSLWNSMLHASLPGVHQPEDLVMLSNPNDSGMWTGVWEGRTDGPRSWLTYEEFEQLRDHADGFSALMASQSRHISWQAHIDGDTSEVVRGRLVSGGFFDVLGARPAIGRLFTTEMDRVEALDAVISYAYWQRRFGGRADVLGKTFSIRSTPLTIIGVTPRGFVGETAAQLPDVWLTLRIQPRVLPGSDWLRDTPPEKVMWLQVFGRLKRGVSAAQAEAQANAVFRRGLESFYGAVERRGEFLDQRLQLWSGARGASSVRPRLSVTLTTLLVAVSVLLLIACANLANLLVARGAARRPEIAVRFSLGATRVRILRQLATESLLLATVGGIAAVPVAAIVHSALERMQAAADDRFAMPFAIDPMVLAFVVSVTCGAAVLFGVLPAWRVTRFEAGTALREQSRSAVGSPDRTRLSHLLVCLQLALSLPLVFGAGLLARTAYNLQRADLGYPAERLLLMRTDVREAAADPTRRDGLLHELRAQLQQIPGVRAVSYSELGVFSGGESASTIEVEGSTPREERHRGSAMDVLGPGYFSTMGIPMLAGREIQNRDYDNARKVCVINEAFARRFFDRRDPIGRHITVIDDDDTRRSWQIVGVARNARTQRLRGDVEPRFFIPAIQPESPDAPTFLIRTIGDAAPVMASVRTTVHRVNDAVAVQFARSIEEAIAPEVAQDRMSAQLAVVFGAVALTLAAIGLYGVLSYGVARRTGEIAIRMALGAPSDRVLSMILRETVGLVIVGLVAGGGLAFWASRLIGSRLHGVAPQDPLTLALAIGLLLAVALSAAYLPARRASRVDPATVLH